MGWRKKKAFWETGASKGVVDVLVEEKEEEEEEEEEEAHHHHCYFAILYPTRHTSTYLTYFKCNDSFNTL